MLERNIRDVDGQALWELLIVQQMDIVMTCLLEVHETTRGASNSLEIGKTRPVPESRLLGWAPWVRAAGLMAASPEALIILMQRVCQVEGEVVWAELDGETPKGRP